MFFPSTFYPFLYFENGIFAFRALKSSCFDDTNTLNKTKRGFLRLGGLPHPKNHEYLLWWPSDKARQGWQNQISTDEEEITETHADATKKAHHYKAHLNTGQKRIVFFHHKDVLGLTSYKFKGVYAYDSQKSNANVGTVWKRICKTMNVNLTGI